MVLLTATPTIIRAITSLPADHRSSLPDPPSTEGGPIAHPTLITLAKLARQHELPYTLDNLLRGSQVYIAPPPPKPEKSPEYLALMERLRKEQEMREYRTLVSRSQGTEGGDDDEDKDDVTPSLVFNILLSVIMCGAAMFYMTRWWTNDAVRVLVSMFVAVVVGVAEIVVYAGYLRNVKRNKAKERAKLERKVVLGKHPGEAEEHPLTVVEEKEEIWGRGKHGGMRRRVREKWEKGQAATEDEK
jgi:TMEM199 family protein